MKLFKRLNWRWVAVAAAIQWAMIGVGAYFGAGLWDAVLVSFVVAIPLSVIETLLGFRVLLPEYEIISLAKVKRKQGIIKDIEVIE